MSKKSGVALGVKDPVFLPLFFSPLLLSPESILSLHFSALTQSDFLAAEKCGFNMTNVRCDFGS